MDNFFLQLLFQKVWEPGAFCAGVASQGLWFCGEDQVGPWAEFGWQVGEGR